MRRTKAVALAIGLSAASRVAAQTPTPSPIAPGLITQDELNLQGRTSLFVGAGARAYGMAGAFLARADDATAASWNPAGLSYLRRPEVTVVGVHNVFNNDVVSQEGKTISRFEGTVVDFAAVTYPLGLKGLSGAAQASYQRAVPFSGDRTIQQEAIPANVSIDAHGGFDVFALGTGWKLSRRWRVGLTLNRWLNGYTQELFRRPQGGRTRQLYADFDLRGWNLNLGLMWAPVESLNVGAVGKTPFTAEVRLGKRRTDFVSDAETQVVAATGNAYESSEVRLDFPGAVGFGASWRLRSQLTISADYTRTFWSDARIHNFFVLPFVPGPQPAPPITIPTASYPGLGEPQEDSEQIRLGVEYVFLSNHLRIPVRAGYFNDRYIFRTSEGELPRFDGLTVGTGIIVGPILFDLAYLFESGTYNTGEGRNNPKTHRFFASLIYRYRGLP